MATSYEKVTTLHHFLIPAPHPSVLHQHTMKSFAYATLLVLLFVARVGASKDKSPPQPLADSAIPTSKALDIASSPPSDAPSDAPSDSPSSAPACKQGKSGSKGRRRRRNLSSKGSKSSKGNSLGDECQGDAYDEIDNYSYQSGGTATCGTVVAAAGALVAAALI